MLSTENPPPDPPCPCQFPHLKSSGSDERAPPKLPLPEVDLPQPPPLLDAAPLPKFSIRDYVFNTRSKDIKKNWPFSLKNLQLCFKHGVNDPLPPFQTLDTVRNQPFKGCAAETSSLEEQNISNFDGEPTLPDNNAVVVLDSSNNDDQYDCKLSEACIDISSCRSGGENDFPSTTTSVSQSEIESVPANRPSSSPLATDNSLLEASVEVEAAAAAAGASVRHKLESPSSRPPGKKCRLIVKFGGNSDRSSNEDIASNCTSVSETMASKVCPVCKTFSSSSNTTLNAHIDQCLSVESTPKWTVDSKLTRHRIKPRKMRLMVDIYATAPRCTLEELDRRNGRSWDVVSSLPVQDTEKMEISVEAKKQRGSPVHPEDAGDVGPVYIDANGTKLRILSKFNDAASLSKVGEDLGPKKPLKGGKGGKLFSTKKKKRHVQKHHKYLKHAPQNKKYFSHKTSQICRGWEGLNGGGKNCEEDVQIPKQFKNDDSGTLRKWVCSKRRGFVKKANRKDGCQPSNCISHVTQDLHIENGQSLLGNSLAERNCAKKFSKPFAYTVSSPENNERMGKSFCEAWVSDTGQCSPGRKRVGSPLLGAKFSDDVERSFPPTKRNAIRLSKNSNSVHDSCKLTPPNSTRNCVLSMGNSMIGIHGRPNNNSDISPISSSKSPRSLHAVVSNAMRFPAVRKKVLPVRSRPSVTEADSSIILEHSTSKNTPAHFRAETEENVVAWKSKVDQQYGSMHDCAQNQSEREDITSMVSHREEALAVKSLEPASHCYDPDDGGNPNCSVRVNDGFLDKVDGRESSRKRVQIHGEDVVTGSPSKIVDMGNVPSCQPVDTEFHRLSNFSKSQSNSLQSVEDYRALLCGDEAPTGPTEPGFVDGQGMYCIEVGNGTIGRNAHMGQHLDSEVGQGNSFAEVDPIPIPGPPGSFLPSPRDMGSEDFQGNSSLTTSRVQSSPDQHDLVDGDSSDSPISATSTISNSAAVRSDLNYSEPSSSGGPYAVQENGKLGFVASRVEPSVDNAGGVPQTTSSDAERITIDAEYFKFNKISIEKGPFGFKNEDQPCCCQRKERFSQGVALNYQESHLLRRRKIAPVNVHAMGKPTGGMSSTRPGNLDLRPEVFPPPGGPNSGSEKVVLPVMQSPAGPIPSKSSSDAGMKFSGRGDCESASPSPSASNPVLRLMGKNLMVVNKDEDSSMPLRQAQLRAQNNHLTSQFTSFGRVTPGSVQNQDSPFFHRMPPQSSVIYSQDPHHTVRQCFDVKLANGFRSHTDSKMPQAPGHMTAGMFVDQQMDGSYAMSVELHKYKGEYNFPGRQNRPKNRSNAAFIHDMENVIPTLDRQGKHADGIAKPIKEVIIIDDVPESEVVIATDVAKYSENWRESQLVSPGVLIPTASNYSSKHMNPFPCYPSQELSLLGEPAVVHNSSFHATTSRLPNTSPVRWGCTKETSGVLQQGPFMAASSSTSHMRSALYYSPSMS